MIKTRRECEAELHIGDDYGDGTATMRCQLPLGHDNEAHQERWRDGKCLLRWEGDDSEVVHVGKLRQAEEVWRGVAEAFAEAHDLLAKSAPVAETTNAVGYAYELLAIARDLEPQP